METGKQVSEPRALKRVTGEKIGVLLTSTAVPFQAQATSRALTQSYGLQYLEGLEGGGGGEGEGEDRWTENKRK